VDRYLVTHEFVKRLHQHYRERGIEIPFPQRVMHWPPGNGVERFTAMAPAARAPGPVARASGRAARGSAP
jgi:small-conductance mechanosensitive channel